MTPQGARAAFFLRSLLKLLAIVLIAGALGFALGTGLSTLSEQSDPGAPAAGTETATPPATTSTATVASSSPAPPTQTTAPQSASPSPLAQVRVSVLDARMFTDSTPSGRRRQSARVTVRLRAANAGAQRVKLRRPILRVGSVRIHAGPTAGPSGAQFKPLGAGAQADRDAAVLARGRGDAEARPRPSREAPDRRAVGGDARQGAGAELIAAWSSGELPVSGMSTYPRPG